MNKKLSIGVKILSVSPAHVHFSIFANMIPEEQEHARATRASLGNAQTLRNEEFGPFMTRLGPDILTASETSWDRVREYEINGGLSLHYTEMSIHED